MKRTLMALTAFAAAAAFTTGFTGTAQASGPNAGPGESMETAAVCSAVAEENRAVWAQPATGPTVGGVIAGRTYNADCALVPGGTYTACGATTDQWAYINYAGDDWGYLPSTCLTWAS